MKLVLDVYIATSTSTIQVTVSPSAYPSRYKKALAFETIPPPDDFRLATYSKFGPVLESTLGGYFVPNFRFTLVLGLSLFTEFIVSAYWSVANQPTTNLFPFGTSLSAFWLVLHNDDSIKRFVLLSMTNYARRDSTLGLQLPP
ncbi:hypothetical protein [Nostoc sp.]|uniref:hypothetical protein n=1 Tax=Nostoc sp. TaxID=1180 RepID=UPI002FEF0F4B